MPDSRSTPILGWLIGGATVLAAPGAALADGGDVDLEYAGHYLKGGINLGTSHHGEQRGDGIVLAFEGGWTYLDEEFWWTGATCEVGRDIAGDDSTRFAVGPKLGIAFLGLDARYMGERNNGKTEHGFNIRIRGTVGYIGGYIGFSDVGGDFFVDLGLQLKGGPRVVDTDGDD